MTVSTEFPDYPLSGKIRVPRGVVAHRFTVYHIDDSVTAYHGDDWVVASL